MFSLNLNLIDDIFFGTYSEYYEDMREFHQHLHTLLKPAGIYSFFISLSGVRVKLVISYVYLKNMQDNTTYKRQSKEGYMFGGMLDDNGHTTLDS
ncbi:protein arginine N-methyltransferase 2-like [Macadamia integrifolia]|uniref:protein arginine N-methyltransferase 2-like n=1 Tax=Macadamia integrifolia TaxID=60698 RepID=UPI001C4E390C|nr:protein arginine N-methyltransferase 2-like [Macadamia integrifolia]